MGLEPAGLLAGPGGVGAQVLDLGQEAGDLGGAGVGQLGGALGAGFGSGQVDLGPGSQRVGGTAKVSPKGAAGLVGDPGVAG